MIRVEQKNGLILLYEGEKNQERLVGVKKDIGDNIQLKIPKKKNQKQALNNQYKKEKNLSHKGFSTPSKNTYSEPQLDEKSKWLKLWHKALAWVVSKHRAEWKEDRYLRLLTAQNKVESRKRDVMRLAAIIKAENLKIERDKQIKTRELEISRHLSGRQKPIKWVTESSSVGELSIKESKKKIALEKIIKHLDEKRQREQIIKQQMAEREASLEISRKLDESMRHNFNEVF